MICWLVLLLVILPGVATAVPDPELAGAVALLPEQDLLIYRDRDSQYQVTVFTDVNCPFSRSLHQQLEDYLMYGIALRYAAFPNLGNALAQMHGVWCSSDRQAAMDRAMRGELVSVSACHSEAVRVQQALALRFRFQATPTIVTPAGQILYGHVPAARLLEVLEAEASADSGDQIQ
jgi:thiol:disulfide interchange protein DsbC